MFKPKLDTSGQNWTVTWTEIGRPWTASYQRLWTFWILKLGKNKKFSLTFFKIFLTFFLKFRVFCDKPSCTKGLECVKLVQFSVQFSVQFYKNTSELFSTKNYRKSLSFCPNLENRNPFRYL